jgi:hypothetical protein
VARSEAATLNQGKPAAGGDLPNLVESASNLLGQVPFLKSDRENSALKLVENFTWLSIFALWRGKFTSTPPCFREQLCLLPLSMSFSCDNNNNNHKDWKTAQ